LNFSLNSYQSWAPLEKVILLLKMAFPILISANIAPVGYSATMNSTGKQIFVSNNGTYVSARVNIIPVLVLIIYSFWTRKLCSPINIVAH
jgi:hypothetical protein